MNRLHHGFAGGLPRRTEGVYSQLHMEPMVQAAADRLRRIERRKRTELETRRDAARVWAREITPLLVAADPTVRRIIGFGSTFEVWRSYRMNSDIDLAVEQLRSELAQDLYFVEVNAAKNREMTERIAGTTAPGR